MNQSKGIFGSVPGSPDTNGAAPSPFQALSGNNDNSSSPNPFGNSGQEKSPFAPGSLDSVKPEKISDPQPKPESKTSPFELAESEDELGSDAPRASAPAVDAPFAAASAKTEPPQLKPTDNPEPSAELGSPPVMPAEDTPQESYDPSEIRQLELRAIFGVDRELSADEILQRLQSLAGIRSVTLIGADALDALDVLKRSLAQETAPMRVTFGGSPMEFIRSGDICLAVLNDGSFAPGIKETIIIAARELNRMP